MIGNINVYPRQRFEVLQAPMKKIIRTYLNDIKVKRKSILNNKVLAVMQIVETKLLWVVLLTSVLINLVRWSLTSDDVSDILEMICLIPVYTVLPIFPLTFPIIWYLTSYYGSARLKVLFAQETMRPSTNSDNIKPNHIDISKCMKIMWDILKGEPYGIPRNVNLLYTLGSITTFCCVDKNGILCETSPIPEKLFFFKNKNKLKERKLEKSLMESFTNKDFYFQEEDNVLEDEVIEDENNMNDFDVLTISYDPDSATHLQFDDVTWEECLTSIKPLGMNILLNSSCDYPMKALRNQDFIGHLYLMNNDHATFSNKGCLCNLSKHIGCAPSLPTTFTPKKQILAYRQLDNSADMTSSFNYYLSIVKDKHVPYMLSNVVYDDNQGIYQLLTQGTGDIILDVCTDVWNGEEISQLKETDRKKALNFFQRMNITGTCIAFSYRPVFENTKDMNDLFVEFPKYENPLNDDDGDISFGTKSRAMNKHLMKDIDANDMLNGASLKHLSQQNDKEAKDNITRNQSQQIFLGMITLTEVLKKDVVTVVEQLDNAGIRFVHFSDENEILSRVFCQRLGLETGWNCHISLGESSGITLDEWSNSAISDSCPLLHEEDYEQLNRSITRGNTETTVSLHKHEDDNTSNQYQNYDELYFMSNRSKLPRGIRNMRSHLSEVDDVPLLVPLFTDCNPPAVSEMVHIMQEYDDIVCCIGSSLNTNNSQIFTQSDISLSFVPTVQDTCSQHATTVQDTCSQHATTSDTFNNVQEDFHEYKQYENIINKGPLHLSCVLNSLTCSLSARRKDNFPLASLLCEARRITIGCQNCFLFLFSSHVMLSLLMLSSSLFLLPPPLSGIQLLWLICIVLPIISISLIGTPVEKGLMKLLTGKRMKTNRKELIVSFVYQFLPTFGSSILFIVLVLQPWLLYTTCQQTSLTCHWLLGNRNSSSSDWNGWIDELKGGYYMVQDLILFYVTCTLVIISMSFVHQKKLLWKRNPFTNKPWVLCVFLCLLLQLLHTLTSLYYWSDLRSELSINLSIYSPAMYSLSILSLVVLVLLSEVVKRHNIRKYIRFQKRERLKFNTKLGMNSPV